MAVALKHINAAMPKRAAYTKLLSPAERMAGIKLGAMLALHQNGILLANADGILKRALSPLSAVDTGMKAILATSLIAGIPIGAAAHMIGRQVSANRKSERERLARIKYYRDVTGQLDAGLSGIQPSQVRQ